MNEGGAPPHAPTPWHLWLIGVLGLLWNSVGAFDYAMMQFRHASYVNRLTSEQIEAFVALPAWLVACWALAVWGGALGALLLLARKKHAVSTLLVSWLTMAVTGIHNLVASDGLYAIGGTSDGFVTVIFTMAFSLWLYARLVRKKGLLT